MTIQECYQTSLSNWPKKSGGWFSQISDVSPDIGNLLKSTFLTQIA
jgi:hypothetical protein